MTISACICVRFNAGLRRDTNTATNKWDASSLTVAWSAFPLLYERSHRRCVRSWTSRHHSN
jgi:hypothetical protein